MPAALAHRVAEFPSTAFFAANWVPPVDDAVTGFLDANAPYVVGVPGGVVRARKTAPGKVAVIWIVGKSTAGSAATESRR